MLQRLGIVAALAAAAWGQEVIDIARKAPPELFADTVVRLAERGKIPKDRELALLEEAFDAAKHAKEPMRLRAVPQVFDRRPGLRETALKAGLDTLSLEARIVERMAASHTDNDADKARELFQGIDHPLLDVRPCADPMIADDSAYFEMAAKAGGMNPMALIAAGTSPGDLASFAKMLLADHDLPRDQFQLLLGALALKMETAAPDYREFTMTAEDLAKALDGLAARARETGVSAEPLGEAARKLAVTQLNSPRCEEEFGGSDALVSWYNRTFAKSLSVIVHEEMAPKEGLGPAEAQPFFADEKGKQLSAEFQKFRADRLGHPGAVSPELTGKLEDFASKLEAWTPAGSAIEQFHQKMIAAHGLYQLMAPGEARDGFAGWVTGYLKGSAAEREFPAEWWYEVTSFTEFELVDKAKLLKLFRESGDAGLALYAAQNP